MIKMKLIPRFLIHNLKAGEKMRWIYQLMGFVSDWASNYLNLFTNKSIGAERKNFQLDPESLTVKAGELRKTAKTILYVLINTVFFLLLFILWPNNSTLKRMSVWFNPSVTDTMWLLILVSENSSCWTD